MINWKIRYSAILKRHPELLDRAVSILEVGCGDEGVARYLRRPVTGLEPRFGPNPNSWLRPVTGSVLDIPFAPDSFDIVLCVDVLAHLNALKRPRALAQLFRVARRKVVISCPCDPFAAEGEQQLAHLLSQTIGIPEWLEQHLRLGLPTVGSMLQEIVALGAPFDIEGNEGLMQHFGGILLDHFLPFSRNLLVFHELKSPLDAPIEASKADLFYSYAFTVHKTALPPQPAAAAAGWANAPAAPANGEAPESMPVAALYCVSHRPADLSHLGRVRPLFAGSAADRARPGELTDIPLTGARLDNRRWSELSAIYRVWRDGPRSNIVGFCHYRRLFAFRTAGASAREIRVRGEELRRVADRLYDNDTIDETLGDAIIVPPPLTVEEPSVWLQYSIAHYPDDWCRILGIFSRRHRHLLPYAVSHFESRLLYANNMFVMRWDRFEELCGLWFDVLGEFAAEVAAGRGSSYQDRDVAFLAERIFDLWLKLQVGRGVRLIEVPIFVVDDARPADAEESAPLLPDSNATRAPPRQ